MCEAEKYSNNSILLPIKHFGGFQVSEYKYLRVSKGIRGYSRGFRNVLGLQGYFCRFHGASGGFHKLYRGVPWDHRGYRDVPGVFHGVSEGFNRFLGVLCVFQEILGGHRSIRGISVELRGSNGICKSIAEHLKGKLDISCN